MKKPAAKTFSKANFQQYMRRNWTEKGFDLKRRKRVGVSIDQVVRLSVKRNSKIKTPYLDLWLAILDEFVSWQLSLLTVFYGTRKRGKFSNFERTIIVILMKIVSDSIAMRHLIFLGYDVSAQMLLRSIGEYAELYVAILDDPTLADDFVLSDTPESAKKFWNTRIARGALQKRVEKAWHDWFHAKETVAASWFANWGRQSNIRLSAFIHPSFAGGMFSALPFKTKHTNENWLGIWGDKSEGSVDTIYMYASYMFPMFLLHDGFPFESFNAFLHAPLKYDKENEFHKHVQDGRYVLASLILSLGKHSNRKYIFPKYDTSIFRNGRKEKSLRKTPIE